VDGAVIEQLDAALARWAVDPSTLCLEIDEQLLSDHGNLVRSVLPALRGRDVRIGIDGIGRGQSSLTGLIQTAPTQIKLASTLIEQCRHLPSAESLVRGVRCLADELGAAVVAVGVESTAQLERLRVLGCHRVQGFALARPMPGPELADWLLKQAGREPPSSAPLGSPPTYH
jgi:EAL domain-containing protein (putative c-di-GMP-specific phosphodiesterase class I)